MDNTRHSGSRRELRVCADHLLGTSNHRVGRALTRLAFHSRKRRRNAELRLIRDEDRHVTGDVAQCEAGVRAIGWHLPPDPNLGGGLKYQVVWQGRSETRDVLDLMMVDFADDRVNLNGSWADLDLQTAPASIP
jgi:hypothetical protein